MPSELEIVMILALAVGCLLLPHLDRKAVRKLVKEQTGHDVEIPHDRLMYRMLQTFGLGFVVGGFVGPWLLGWSALEGGEIGGVAGIVISVAYKYFKRRREKIRAKAVAGAAADAAPSSPEEPG